MILSDVCEFIVDCPHTTAEDEGTGYPLIRTPNIGKGRLIFEGVHRVSQETYNKRNLRATPQEGDLIFAREAPAGNVAVIKKGQEVCLGQRTVLIRPNKELVDPDYLTYYLLAPQQQYKLLGTANGATVAHVNLPIIRNLPIHLPNIEKQTSIALVLSTYDDLIENNQKQIKLLEEAAQRLYKEWFVDLRFPGYEDVKVVDGVPEGWKKLPLGELIEYEIGGGWGEEQPTEKCDQPAYVIRGTDLYDVTHGNARSIPYRYHAKNNLDSRKLQDGDIVFEVSGGSKNEGVARTALITKSLLNYLESDVICASFCKLIRLKNKGYAKYMHDTFQYLRNSGETEKYDKRSASSIVNYRWKDFLEQQFIFVPTDEIFQQYNGVVMFIQKTISNKAQSIEHAKEARDRLLPKLMSGELDLSEKKKAEILQPLPKLSYNDFLLDLGMAARAKTVSEADLRAMYEAYLDDDAEDRD